MNRIYRLVWSHHAQSMVAVAENVKGRGKNGGKAKTLATAVAGALLAISSLPAISADQTISTAVTTQWDIGAQSGFASGNSLTITGAGSVIVGNSNTAGNVLLNSNTAGSIINRGIIGDAGVPHTTVGVYINHGTLTGSFVNEGAISAINAPIKIESGSSIAGNVSNSGQVSGFGFWSLHVGDSTVAGRVENSGTIGGIAIESISIESSVVRGGVINTNTGLLQHDLNISVSEIGTVGTNADVLNAGSVVGSVYVKAASIVHGSIRNEGTIDVSLIVDASTVTGRISNSGTISDGAGIYSGGLVQQGVTNTGLMQSTSSSAFFLSGASTINGGLTNSGRIISYAASSSAININSGSLLAGGITNSGSIHGGARGISIDSGNVTGGITNNSGGTISGNSSGIGVSHSTVEGGIRNSGTIVSAGTRNSAAIALWTGATVNGGITNTGLIDGGTSGAAGILLGDAVLSGGINNLFGGTIIAASAGIIVSNSSVVSGISNNSGGTISGGSTGIKVDSATIAGGITNSGHIAGGDSGVSVVNSATVSGSIINSQGGTISGGGTGIYLNNSATVGRIVNNGRITGGSTGIIIYGNSVITSGITNSGLIEGTGGDGIYGETSANISGGIHNMQGGTIVGASNGITLTSVPTVGGITNAGLIRGISGSGIEIATTGAITGSIINSARGTISGGATGLSLSTVTMTGGIINAGLISGGNNAAGIYISSSTIDGGITNSGTISGGTHAIRVDSSASVPYLHITGTSSQLIGDVSAVNTDVFVKSGAIFGNTNAFDVNSFTVESGGLFNFSNGPHTTNGLPTNGVKVANGFTNDGIVSVAANATPTITGDYVQNAGGIYRMGLTGITAGTYGVLNVTGNATVAGTINVVVSGSPTITNGTTVAGVIRSAVMTATPANITVTDNNLFLNFTAAEVTIPGSDLDLIIAADANALPNAVAPNNPSAVGVAAALQDIYNSGVPAGFQPLFDALSNMTPQALNAALIELTPSLQGAAAQAGVSALHSMNKIIQSRMESVQGLNSGDDTADQYAWARVFGNWGDQNDHRGVTGFESQTQGVAIGMDKPINDRIRAGGLVTYANTDLKSNLGNSKVDVDTYEIAGYGSYNIDPQTDINVQLDVGLNKANSARHISFLGTTAKADFDSFNWHLSGGVGHLFQLSDKTNLTPAMRVDYTHVKTDGYTEKGAGSINQHVDGSNYEELLLSVDAKLSHKLTDDGLKFVANGSVGYDFINKQSQTTSTFTGGGPSFVTNGLEVSPWIYRGGLGLVKETGNGMEFSARYDAEGRTSGYLNQTASVKVRWAF